MMLKSSIQGKITAIKKKGQFFVVSVKTGRDVIKCLTSVDVIKNGLEKGNTLYLEGYYSIKNALFPITNLYKVVNGKKIAINIEEHHFYEQIETMPPMTKKKRGKDGSFAVPKTLTRDNSDDEIGNIAISVPVINPENLVSKTKPVYSNPHKQEKQKHNDSTFPKPVTKTEKVVEEKNDDSQTSEVKEENISEIKQEKPSKTESTTENLFGINIPNLTAELEEDNDTSAETIGEETVDVEENDISTETEKKQSATVEEPITEQKATVENKEYPKSSKTQIEFDDDLGLPIPTFKSNYTCSAKSNTEVEEKPKVSVKSEVAKPATRTYEKPTAPAKVVPFKETSSVSNQHISHEKVVEQPKGKYPVKFSSADLM